MKLRNKKYILDNSALIILMYFIIKLSGTVLAIYVFNKFTPLIDSFNYINNFYVNDQGLGVNHPIRTLAIQKITTFLVYITRSNFLPHLFFSFFSGLGILIYSLMTKRPIALLILLLPTSLIWTSIVGKEAIFFGCISLTLLFWIKIITKKMQFKDWIMLGTLILICCFLRPHYTIGCIWILLSAFIINLEKKYILLVIFFSLFLLVTIYLLDQHLLQRGFTSIDPSGRASRFNALNIDPIFNSSNIESFKKYFYIGFLFGIIGVFPSEIIDRPEFIIFFLEGILILCFPFLISYQILNKSILHYKKNKYLENLFLGILPALFILMLMHAPFGLLNPGSAIRWRANFELIFYFAPLLIYLESKKND